jgi:hypothetical protein
MIIWGSTVRDTVQSRGDFFCPNCNAARQYEQRRKAKYFTLYFIPAWETETLGDYVKCLGCNQQYDPSILLIEFFECTDCGGALLKKHKVCPHCGADCSEEVTETLTAEAVGKMICDMASDFRVVFQTAPQWQEMSMKNTDLSAVESEVAAFYFHYLQRVIFNKLGESNYQTSMDGIFRGLTASWAQRSQEVQSGLISSEAVAEKLVTVFNVVGERYRQATEITSNRDPMSPQSLYGILYARIGQVTGLHLNALTAVTVGTLIQSVAQKYGYHEAAASLITPH